ncbi:MAG: anthranilate synthase component I, partial [Gemmatimonadota bacterium]|nr:anthranilate synthase component I [Gemmatimonadota bacterium]
MQPTFDIVADLDTPVSAYLKMAPFHPRFLLESVEGGTQLGRYSFIGFGEADEIQLNDGTLSFNGNASNLPDTPQGILDMYRRILKDTEKNHFDPGSLPFAGGMVGVTSFEMHRLFEPRPGGNTERGLLGRYLVPQAVLAFDHLTRRAALLTAGTDSERASLKKDVITALRGPLP